MNFIVRHCLLSASDYIFISSVDLKVENGGMFQGWKPRTYL